MNESLQCSDALRLIENGAHLIDVRSELEHQRGAIKGSRNIPLQTLPQHLHTLESAKSVIVYCASGARSRVAKDYLEQMGIGQVHDFGSIRNLGCCT